MKYIHNDAEHYFAASNTFFGFKSYFDGIFGENNCDRLYILKGGPGCGKSTFMKKIGDFCEKNGFTAEYFRCSSDPSSLDGIIIKELRIAVADGTSPHVIEPKLAGVYEEIIDLGQSWNIEKLSENSEKIRSLSSKKASLYKKAYGFLDICRKIDSVSQQAYQKYIFYDKLEKSAERLVNGILKKSSVHRKKDVFSETIRVTEAFSGSGKQRLCTLEDNADMCIFVKIPDFISGTANAFMDAIRKKLSEKGAEAIICPGAPNPSALSGIYLPNERVSITPYAEELVDLCDRNGKKCRIINAVRFIDTKQLSQKRGEFKFYRKLYSAFEEKAIKALYEAGKIHAEMEKYYGQCTDYSVTEKITTEFLQKLIDGQKARP